jgi:hypothetical protein
MVVHGELVHSPPVALALDEQRAHVFVVTVGPLITGLTRSGSVVIAMHTAGAFCALSA